MMYPTAESAQEAAREQVRAQYQDHVYVYRLKDEFGLHWHPEDRYVSSYLPDGARIVLHGTRLVGFIDGEWTKSIIWEQREQHSQGDFESLAGALGDDVARALLELDED